MSRWQTTFNILLCCVCKWLLRKHLRAQIPYVRIHMRNEKSMNSIFDKKWCKRETDKKKQCPRLFFLFFLSFMNESNFFLFSCDAVVQSNSAACTSFCFPLFLCFIFTFLLVFVCGMCISSLDRCFFCVFRLVFLSRCSHRWPCSAATIVDMLVRLQFYHTIYVPMYPTINYTIHQNTQIYIV